MNENESLGYVVNPLDNVYINDFTFTLGYYLKLAGSLVEQVGSRQGILVKGIEILDKKPAVDSNVFYIRVPVEVDKLAKG